MCGLGVRGGWGQEEQLLWPSVQVTLCLHRCHHPSGLFFKDWAGKVTVSLRGRLPRHVQWVTPTALCAVDVGGLTEREG